MEKPGRSTPITFMLLFNFLFASHAFSHFLSNSWNSEMDSNIFHTYLVIISWFLWTCFAFVAKSLEVQSPFSGYWNLSFGSPLCKTVFNSRKLILWKIRISFSYSVPKTKPLFSRIYESCRVWQSFHSYSLRIIQGFLVYMHDFT